MASTSDTPQSQQGDLEVVPGESALRVLPSGRSITARVGDEGEAIEIHSPEGQLELSISLTEEGPVLRLQGARLELISPDSVSVQCREFEVATSSSVQLRANGAIDMQSGSDISTKSAGQTFIDGDFVNLNCRDREGYHDAPGQEALAADSGSEEPNESEDNSQD